MTTHEAGSGVQSLGEVRQELLLAERIEIQIERRACGRIRDLHVVCLEDQVILMGRSRTYHAKQMAQEAAMDFSDGAFILANRIIVA